MRTAIACAALVLTLGWAAPPPAQAEGVNPAVGRANQAGFSAKRHCTAFGIGARAALTAAHCIRNSNSQMVLLFGYDRANWQLERRTVETHDLGNDVALLCLDGETPQTFPLSRERVARNTPVRLLGYGRPAVHAQTVRECQVMTPVGADLLLNCPASPGFSGGPIVNDAGAVVGIMSRTGRGTSYAAQVPARIPACPG